MKECEYYGSLMSRLLDGELTAAEREALYAHLDDCPDCAEKLDALAVMTKVLREDRPEPPAGLARGVMERIAAENKAAAPQRQRQQRRRQKPVQRVRPWMRLAAVACLVLAVGLGAVNHRNATLLARETAERARTAPPPLAEDAADSESLARSFPDAAENGVMTVSAADSAVPAVSAQAMTVLDEDGNALGLIPPESADAFTALLVDGQVLADSWPEDWTPLCIVDAGEDIFHFAADPDQTQLVWWRSDSDTVTLSPGSPAELLLLVASE